MTSQDLSKSKKKVHKLKDAKLRKIRYELRTLLYLVYNKRIYQLRDKELQSFRNHFFRCPIICWFCGTRMEDLIQDPDTKYWFCVNHYDEDLEEETLNRYY